MFLHNSSIWPLSMNEQFKDTLAEVNLLLILYHHHHHYHHHHYHHHLQGLLTYSVSHSVSLPRPPTVSPLFPDLNPAGFRTFRICSLRMLLFLSVTFMHVIIDCAYCDRPIYHL